MATMFGQGQVIHNLTYPVTLIGDRVTLVLRKSHAYRCQPPPELAEAVEKEVGLVG